MLTAIGLFNGDLRYVTGCGGRKFGIFDASRSSSDRKEHLAGRLAALLMAKAPELFTSTPNIEQGDVLAQ